MSNLLFLLLHIMCLFAVMNRDQILGENTLLNLHFWLGSYTKWHFQHLKEIQKSQKVITLLNSQDLQRKSYTVVNSVALIWNYLIRSYSKLCHQTHFYFLSNSMFDLSFPGITKKYANSSSNLVHSKHISLFFRNINYFLKNYYKKL